MPDMQFHNDLARFGPSGSDSLDLESSQAWCRRLAVGHYENFSVITRLVPGDLRDDFAAVYAFCRTADDLGDEIGDPEESRALLGWFREQLDAAFDGTPRHPALVALQPVIARHDLSPAPFTDLLSAFLQDQVKGRYETWAELQDYCRRSAAPVGRLVLQLLDEPQTAAALDRSDRICIALQLTNHWQDVRRDILERDRIYIPREEYAGIRDFEERMVSTARQGWAVDHTFLEESRRVIERCVRRTWPMYESGSTLIPELGPGARPIVELLMSGGVSMLQCVEDWNYETVLHRPRLGVATKGLLVLKAWWRSRLSRRVAAHSAKGVSSTP